MKEVALAGSPSGKPASFAACLATILELPLEDVPELPSGEELPGWRVMRWLGGLGLGLVPVADAASFDWAGPWIGWCVPATAAERRAVVMYGVPSGVAWDPSGVTETDGWRLGGGFVISASTLPWRAHRSPRRPPPPEPSRRSSSRPRRGARHRSLEEVAALAGRGLDGDRHVTGAGTFPLGTAGQRAHADRGGGVRVVRAPTRAARAPTQRRHAGIALNDLVGHEFRIGSVRCRGMRLCEPCTVIQRYAARPVLRPLVHRGGLRADILEDGVVRVGDVLQGGVGVSSSRARS